MRRALALAPPRGGPARAAATSARTLHSSGGPSSRASLFTHTLPREAREERAADTDSPRRVLADRARHAPATAGIPAPTCPWQRYARVPADGGSAAAEGRRGMAGHGFAGLNAATESSPLAPGQDFADKIKQLRREAQAPAMIRRRRAAVRAVELGMDAPTKRLYSRRAAAASLLAALLQASTASLPWL